MVVLGPNMLHPVRLLSSHTLALLLALLLSHVSEGGNSLVGR